MDRASAQSMKTLPNRVPGAKQMQVDGNYRG